MRTTSRIASTHTQRERDRERNMYTRGKEREEWKREITLDAWILAWGTLLPVSLFVASSAGSHKCKTLKHHLDQSWPKERNVIPDLLRHISCRLETAREREKKDSWKGGHRKEQVGVLRTSTGACMVHSWSLASRFGSKEALSLSLGYKQLYCLMRAPDLSRCCRKDFELLRLPASWLRLSSSLPPLVSFGFLEAQQARSRKG
jgi:hypothetical protein